MGPEMQRNFLNRKGHEITKDKKQDHLHTDNSIYYSAQIWT